MLTRSIFLTVAAGLLAGCSGGSNPPPDYGADGNKIADLVGGFDDILARPKELDRAFAGPASKASPRRFAGHQFALVGRPEVSGDGAKATVAVEKSSTGAKVEKVWEFTKVNGEWKIKDAPMP